MTTPADGGSDGPLPARYIALLLVGSVCAIGWGLIQQSKAWLALAVAFVVANAIFTVAARRRLRRPPSIGRLTGRTLNPQAEAQFASAPSAIPATAGRWIGGANFPGFLGRTNATAPFGLLELCDQSLTLRMRPRFLATMFGSSQVSVSPAEVESIFPAKGMLRSPGVGIQLAGKPVFYFWTRRREEILTALAAVQFPARWEERRFTY